MKTKIMNNLNFNKRFRQGFTLAEVLITLSIIGVVAAMTLPSLIQDYKEKATVTRLKKTYSVLENAYSRARQENGDVTTWFTSSNAAANSKIFFDNLKPYMNIVKDCGYSSGCLTPGFIKKIDGSDYHAAYDTYVTEYKFVLADGTAIWILLDDRTCTSTVNCGNIKVDVDGKRGPYAWGKDVFLFKIQADKIIPVGVKGDTYGNFKNQCLSGNGGACAGWVIFNENMDYLHCNDLDWGVKTKCK